MDRLPPIDNPKYVIFSDFDATYLSHGVNLRHNFPLQKLECFLKEYCQQIGLIFGFVTGSSYFDLKRKMEDHGLELLPHFIASSLGTEISYECKRTQGQKDQTWEIAHRHSFNLEKITNLVNYLQSNGIELIKQPNKNNSQYKISYYYFPTSDQSLSKAKNLIRKKSQQLGLGINISACNPLNGDPANSYDIDFIPINSGKSNVVNWLLQKYGICRENSYAFGDSENDINMLKTVGNGYLVANAIISSKKWKLKKTEGCYAKGIFEIITNLEFSQSNL